MDGTISWFRFFDIFWWFAIKEHKLWPAWNPTEPTGPSPFPVVLRLSVSLVVAAWHSGKGCRPCRHHQVSLACKVHPSNPNDISVLCVPFMSLEKVSSVRSIFVFFSNLTMISRHLSGFLNMRDPKTQWLFCWESSLLDNFWETILRNHHLCVF